MSQDERLQEALTDFRELYDERLIKLIERYRRTFTISKKFPLAITCSIKTARNNRWSMTLYARKKTNTKSPGFIPLLKYRTSHGIGFLYPKIMDNWIMDVSVFVIYSRDYVVDWELWLIATAQHHQRVSAYHCCC